MTALVTHLGSHPMMRGPGPGHILCLASPEDPSCIPPLSSQQLSLEHASVYTSCDLSLSFRKPFPWRPVPMAVWPHPPGTPAFLVPELVEVGSTHLLGCPAGAPWLPGSLAACVVHMVTSAWGFSTFTLVTRLRPGRQGPGAKGMSHGTTENCPAPQE